MSHVVSLKLTIWWGLGFSLVGEPGVGAPEGTAGIRAALGSRLTLCADPAFTRPSAPSPMRPLTPSGAWGFPAWPHRTPALSLSLLWSAFPLSCSCFPVTPCGGASLPWTLPELPSSSCTWGSSLRPPDCPCMAQLPGRLTPFPSISS